MTEATRTQEVLKWIVMSIVVLAVLFGTLYWLFVYLHKVWEVYKPKYGKSWWWVFTKECFAKLWEFLTHWNWKKLLVVGGFILVGLLLYWASK